MAWPQLAALPLTRSVTLSKALHPERRLPPEHSEDDTKVPPSQSVVRMKQKAFSPSFLGLSLEEIHCAMKSATAVRWRTVIRVRIVNQP